MPTLISGSNFEAKRLPSTDGRGDWAIWDKGQGKWVAMNPYPNEPYVPCGGERACNMIVSSGLYEGYDVISIEAEAQP